LRYDQFNIGNLVDKFINHNVTLIRAVHWYKFKRRQWKRRESGCL